MANIRFFLIIQSIFFSFLSHIYVIIYVYAIIRVIITLLFILLQTRYYKINKKRRLKKRQTHMSLIIFFLIQIVLLATLFESAFMCESLWILSSNKNSKKFLPSKVFFIYLKWLSIFSIFFSFHQKNIYVFHKYHQ